MSSIQSLVLPKSVILSAMDKKSSPKGKIIATSAEKVYDLNYYLKGALAGGICCAVTHGALCPVDVVKTRIQLDPVTYNKGLIGGFRQVIAAEGAGGLLTGLGPTVVGYFIQGTIL
jgi:solute carrier family 25 (mitochondrial phosphate transporter), member 3